MGRGMGPTRKLNTSWAVVVTGLALLTASAPARAAARCERPHAAHWNSYGHDLANSRNQPRERAIRAANVGTLRPSWRLDAEAAGLDGWFQNTPVVAGGCVYDVSDRGWVVAADAANGKLLWTKHLPYDVADISGAAVGSPLVAGGRVYVVMDQFGAPYLAALDQGDGRVLWTTTLEKRDLALALSSPIFFRGVVVAAFGDKSSNADARGGLVFIDAATGEVLKKTYDIPADDVARGYGGGTIWSTPVIDGRTGYGYVGTGNPVPNAPEHPQTNAILKFDADPRRASFGEIVGAYKGQSDQYVDGLADQPVCHSGVGRRLPYPLSRVTCANLDLDFGASPTLFRGTSGRLLVGELQKSGVYHVVYARSMRGAWTKAVSIPCFFCNAASGGFDGERLYTVGSPGGRLYALRPDGTRAWSAVIADATHYESVSSANGLVYTSDGNALRAFASQSGHPALVLPLADRDSAAAPVRRGADTLQKHPDWLASDNDPAVAGLIGNTSSGIAIAGGRVFVAFREQLIALTPTAGER
jgi:polyvinyl alcohol dehydrogenase (cytochrome)